MAVDPPRNGDEALSFQFLVELPNELVGVGPRHAQLIHPDKLVLYAGSSFIK